MDSPTGIQDAAQFTPRTLAASSSEVDIAMQLLPIAGPSSPARVESEADNTPDVEKHIEEYLLRSRTSTATDNEDQQLSNASGASNDDKFIPGDEAPLRGPSDFVDASKPVVETLQEQDVPADNGV